MLLVRSAGLRFHQHHRVQLWCCAWSLEILLGLAVWIFASFASAQASPGPSAAQQRKSKQTPSALPLPQGSGATLLEPLPPATSEPTAPHAPEVTWDGKLLTVDADNSSLMQILMAVRAKTGATIDAPSSAANERVMLHIGPAPIREVLSSLLYGTDFDYIIQAPDDDADGLRSVVLTVHGAMDDTTMPSTMMNASTSASAMTTANSTSVSSMTTGTSNPTEKNIRMMPGWASPSKPKFQADAEAALAARKAAEEGQASDGSAAGESASANDPSAAAQEPGSVSMPTGNESASANSASGNTDSSAPQVAASSAADTSAVADGGTARPGSSSDSGSSDQTQFGQMVQDMTRMFNQRKQIQAQQNQATAPQNQNTPPPSN